MMLKFLQFGWQTPKLWWQDPILPIEGCAIDLFPFVLMCGFLTLAAFGMIFLQRRQTARHVVQFLSAFAFIIGIHPCFCLLRNVVFGITDLGILDIRAFMFLMLFTAICAFTFIFGRLFCFWVCPIGFLQETSLRLGKALGFERNSRGLITVKYGLSVLALFLMVAAFWTSKPGGAVFAQSVMFFWAMALFVFILFVLAEKKMDRRLRHARYVSVGALVAILLARGYFNMPGCVFYCSIDDPASIYPLLAIILAAPILAMAWCRYLCPEGGLFGLIQGQSRWRIHRGSACTQCGSCDKVCDLEAVHHGRVEPRDCLLCGRCLETCPHGALKYGTANDAE